MTVVLPKQFAVSVVIRCYNEEQHIGRLLSGIMQQSIWDVRSSEWWGENRDQIKGVLISL